MKNSAYEIGFQHGVAGRGTDGYKPGARRDETLERYQAGFQHGMRVHHDQGLLIRQRLAQLNMPANLRG